MSATPAPVQDMNIGPELAPSTPSRLLSHFAAGPRRTRTIAYYGAVANLAASVGLVLGGVLADLLSWRIGFFINLPNGVALWTATRRLIAETERIGASLLAGSCMLALALVLVLLPAVVPRASEAAIRAAD